MNSLPTFVSYALAFAGQFKYPLLFVGVVVEGPILMIAAGFLLNQGVFSLAPLFFTLLIGDLVADVGWYYIGYYFVEPFLKRHGHFLSVTPALLEKAKGLFRQYHVKILLISKVTIGFGMALATVTAAGATRVPFKVFLLLNVIGEFILVAVLLTIGYFFGQIYTTIAGGFKIVFIVGAVLISLALLFGVSGYVKNKFMQP